MNLEDIYNLFAEHTKVNKPHSLSRYLKLVKCYSSTDAPEGYCEKHHILPRSVFPEFSKESWNIIKVPARVHFLLHYILFLAIQDERILKAFIFMRSSNAYQSDRYFNSKMYEKAKLEYSNVCKAKVKDLNPFFGKTHSDEYKEKVSKRMKGRVPWNKGKSGSEELKKVGKAISKSLQGLKFFTNGEREIRSISSPGEEWVRGRLKRDWARSEEERLKISQRMSGGKYSWWNNGKVNKRSLNSPGEGWIKGRLFTDETYLKFCKKQT